MLLSEAVGLSKDRQVFRSKTVFGLIQKKQKREKSRRSYCHFYVFSEVITVSLQLTTLTALSNNVTETIFTLAQ